MSAHVIEALVAGLICGLAAGLAVGFNLGRMKREARQVIRRGRRMIGQGNVGDISGRMQEIPSEGGTPNLPIVPDDGATPALPAVPDEGATPALPIVPDEGATPALPIVPDEGATPGLPEDPRQPAESGGRRSAAGGWLTEDGPELPLARDVPRRRVTCTMSAHGRTQTQVIDPGFVWAQADQPGLAVDMHVRATSGTTPMISVRAPDSRAFLEVDGVQIRLSPVAIPWRGGFVVNGDLRFALDEAVRVPEIRVQRPRQPHRIVACAGVSWVAFTDEQPHLAALAAQLYTAEGLDPVGEWRERLAQYCASVGYGEVRVSLLVLGRDGATVTGPLVAEIGIGTWRDSLPGSVRPVPKGEELIVPTAQKVWVPTVRSVSEDRYHQAFVVERAERTELVPGSLRRG